MKCLKIRYERAINYVMSQIGYEPVIKYIMSQNNIRECYTIFNVAKSDMSLL